MDKPKNNDSIRQTDVISGALYLKLIEDYKQYDNKRKNYINSLLNEIDKLKYQIELKEWEIKVRKMCDDLEPQQISNLQYKLYKRRLFIKKLREKIRTLENQNTDLKNEIIKLKLKINSINNCTD